MIRELNSEPGTYALIIASDKTASIEIGKLGILTIRPGFYVYTGSARGPGGLKSRVSRHLKRHKRLHWHIDYLTTRFAVTEVWVSYAENSHECLWASVLQILSGYEEVDGIGASDCKCPSHLYYSTQRPRLAEFDNRIPEVSAMNGEQQLISLSV